MNVSLGLTATAPATNMAAAPSADLPPVPLSFLLALTDSDLKDTAELAVPPVDDKVVTAPEAIVIPASQALPDALLALIAGSTPAALPPVCASTQPAVTTEDNPPPTPPALSAPPPAAEKPAAVADASPAIESTAAPAAPDILFEIPDVPAPPAASPAMVITTSSATTFATPLVTAPPIATAVGDAQWPEAVADSIVWSAGQQLQEAVIQLTPDDMGALEIHIRMEDDLTHVQFQATHALTREALQNALPQLAPLLAQQGLKLGDAQVGSQTPQGSNRHPGKSGPDKSERAEAPSAAPLRLRGRRGLVDDYV